MWFLWFLFVIIFSRFSLFGDQTHSKLSRSVQCIHDIIYRYELMRIIMIHIIWICEIERIFFYFFQFSFQNEFCGISICFTFPIFFPTFFCALAYSNKYEPCTFSRFSPVWFSFYIWMLHTIVEYKWGRISVYFRIALEPVCTLWVLPVQCALCTVHVSKNGNLLSYDGAHRHWIDGIYIFPWKKIPYA